MKSFRSSCWLNPRVGKMPRQWAQQCRVDPAHFGPFSRSGLCPSCRASLLSEAGKKGGTNNGGRPRGSTYKLPRARQPLARRVRRSNAKKPKTPTTSRTAAGGPQECQKEKTSTHRICFRCRRRRDHCREEGCIPTTWTLKQDELQSFLQYFDYHGSPLRRATDCWDVEVIRDWALAAR